MNADFTPQLFPDLGRPTDVINMAMRKKNRREFLRIKP
jgi:hypothetical protein